MPDLGPQSPASTYPGLVQIDGGLSSSLKYLEDGDGTDLPVEVSTNEAVIHLRTRFKDPHYCTFETDDFQIDFGRDDDSDGQSYSLFVPNFLPDEVGQFLTVSYIDGTLVGLEWSDGAAGLDVEGGTLGDSSYHFVQDRFGNNSALLLSEAGAQVVGDLGVFGGLNVFSGFGATYPVRVLSPTLSSAGWTLILPSASPADATNRYLRVTGVDVPSHTVTTAWDVDPDAALRSAANTYAGLQTMGAGLDVNAGPYRLAFTKVSANANLSGSSNPVQVVTPTSSDVTVTLPPSPAANDLYHVSHAGTSRNVIVKNGGGTTLKTLTAGQRSAFSYDGPGTAWVVW